MNSKIKIFALSTMTAAMLIGCGGGSSSSATSTTSTTSTNVPVTKGFLINATAVDNSGNEGIQVMENGKYTNKYSFTGTIDYPITVTGGIVDADNSGTISAGDYDFTGKLTSYSNVVTPITTYLGDPEDTNYVDRLTLLKTLTGAEKSDLISKDPYELLEDNNKVFSVSLALYENYTELMDNNDDNDNINEDDDILETTLNNFVTATTGSTSKEDAYIALEGHLKTYIAITEYTSTTAAAKETEIAKIAELPKDSAYEEWPIQGPTTYADMLSGYTSSVNSNYFSYADKSYMFSDTDNTICEKTSEGDDNLRANYSCNSTYGTWEELDQTMVATMAVDGGKFYAKVIDGNVWTAYSDDAESSDSSDSSDSSSSDTYYSIEYSDLENMGITFNIDNEYLLFKFYPQESYGRTGYLEEQIGDNTYNESLYWEIIDGKLKITLSDGTIDYVKFLSNPANADTSGTDYSTVEYNFGDGGTETLDIVEYYPIGN